MRCARWLTDEIARRDNTVAELRAGEARLDPAMRLETWDKTSKVSFDKRMLAELTSLRFLESHRHVVVLGPVGGVGKTFVSQALGHIACRHGYHVCFARADEMLRTLRPPVAQAEARRRGTAAAVACAEATHAPTTATLTTPTPAGRLQAERASG